MENINQGNPEWNEVESVPFEIDPVILAEVDEFLSRAADPELKFEEWKEIQAEFEAKAKDNPAYRLAYLRKMKNPDMGFRAEMGMIEQKLKQDKIS